MPVQAPDQAEASTALTATVADVTGLANLLKSVAVQTHAVVIASSSGLEIVTELNRTLQAHAYLYSHMFDSYRFHPPSGSAQAASSSRRSTRQTRPNKRTRTARDAEESDASQSSASSTDHDRASPEARQQVPPARTHNEADAPEEEPASVSFELNLQTWISCLNIFGGVGPSRPQSTGQGQYAARSDASNPGGSAAGARGYARTRDSTADPHGHDRGTSVERTHPFSSAAKATRMKLTYQGVGHPLVLELEQEASVLTRCSISTYEPSFLTDMVFDPRQMVAQVIVGSDLMHAAFSEIDATCKKLSILMASPHSDPSNANDASTPLPASKRRHAASMLRFRAISDTGSSEMEFPASLSSADPTGVIEKFVALPGSNEQWYDFTLLSRTMTVLRSSIKTSLRMDEAGLISFQFMMPKYRKPVGAGALNTHAADQATLEEEQDAFCEFLVRIPGLFAHLRKIPLGVLTPLLLLSLSSVKRPRRPESRSRRVPFRGIRTGNSVPTLLWRISTYMTFDASLGMPVLPPGH
ncbi:checkpoint 9-1-1 complex, RAD1 component [Moesziomyces antarcticus T-34]|uniref:Checkpoint 9-1-1 complex, RAD1 component n=1 Tax=Pseudozyma antarctica (strain T-34) TaxID=1151754 RepID=M9LQT3_PSEA3|nr:checkpoint 9-1-1 complex, RAD1 component [Moesziomyces antarcticus T-34]